MKLLRTFHLFMLISYTQQFHLRKGTKRIFPRTSSIKVVHRQPLALKRFSLGRTRKQYTPDIRNTQFYTHKLANEHGRYLRGRKQQRKSPVKEIFDKAWKKTQTVKTSTMVNGILPITKFPKYRNPKGFAQVPDNHFKRLSTYIGRLKDRTELMHENRKENSIKWNRAESSSKINIVFPMRPRTPLINRERFTSNAIYNRTEYRTTPTPPTGATKVSVVDDDVPVTHSAVRSSLISTRNKNSLKQKNLLPKETNFSLKVGHVRQQLSDIVKIANKTSQRDATKKLVKDIVSDSGILNETNTVSDSVDVATLDNVLELIKNISRNIKEEKSNSEIGPQEKETIINWKSSSNITPMVIGISHAVENSANKQTGDIIGTDGNFRLETLRSFQHLAGRSIYGDPLLSVRDTGGSLTTPKTTLAGDLVRGSQKPVVDTGFVTVPRPTTTVRVTTPMFDFSNETADSLEYWGHLTAGLADMLCSYCTQRGFQRCMERHCNRVT